MVRKSEVAPNGRYLPNVFLVIMVMEYESLNTMNLNYIHYLLSASSQ